MFEFGKPRHTGTFLGDHFFNIAWCGQTFLTKGNLIFMLLYLIAGQNTAGNKGFSAMLADEHILIFRFANQLQSRLDFFYSAFVLIFICGSLLYFSSGLDGTRNTSTAESPEPL